MKEEQKSYYRVLRVGKTRIVTSSLNEETAVSNYPTFEQANDFKEDQENLQRVLHCIVDEAKTRT